ncbi:winged helix-turn-helix transcriptional regulator [Deinococcus cellulosilyticus]|uniref:HxlR family transcriptional regulator n=1 Tax=Deinococcus cellulosilyticus (strain DSM 18568 / NBRC 106333 / KACC 11606 / 5516J-15) TaxID=1223518 RepID=A0A511N0B9_DEIC1|nr:helix-turn-helix domain-containing protein [Deinococcus cellulosilyticus]GEM46330.1 HxlR family transcriptional regulator [Deinococcus cellulosilyticus NBRC 106333 = KACC 11606]
MFPGDTPETPSNPCEAPRCPTLLEVLTRIGDKWSLCVIGRLYQGPMRFNALKRSIGGVSQRMLTLTLRGLERDGLIQRTVYPTNPPSVEYQLTELGHTLIGPVKAIFDWAEGHRLDIQQARMQFDAQQPGALQDI